MDLIKVHQDGPDMDLIRKQCCQMLNEEWPRSETLRWRMLDSSREDLPMSLALIQRFSDQKTSVLGHVRLSRIPSDPEAVWLESVVIHPDLRGQGWGKHLMLVTEEFCKRTLRFKFTYLHTIDQQFFYARCGYLPCDPVCAYSGNVKLPSVLPHAQNGSFNNKTTQKSYSDVLKSKSNKSTTSDSKISSSQNTKNVISTTSELENLDSVPINSLNLIPGLSEANKNIPSPPIPSMASQKKIVSLDEEEQVKAECHKIYFRPELKEKPLLSRPLRSLEGQSDPKKIAKNEICRVVVPKTCMKKLL